MRKSPPVDCMGCQAAKEAVFECPYLLTKNSKLMRATLPALINVLGFLIAVRGSTGSLQVSERAKDPDRGCGKSSLSTRS